jgi:endogenous inhibitor of DNA gyrase (YacG/DUF329 family)
MATDEKLTANCPDCGQTVRFPGNRGHIKFNCPGCGGGLEWSPDGRHIPKDVDVAVADTPAPDMPQDTTASFYDALKVPPANAAHVADTPAADAPLANHGNPNSAAAGTAPGGLDALPRRYALLYLAGAIAAGFATPWLDRNAGNDTLMILGFMVALVLTFYLAFRAIRVATRLGVGGSIAILVCLQLVLPLLLPYLQGININALPGFESGPEIAEGHFKEATPENTTPAEMDDLMEGWE